MFRVRWKMWLCCSVSQLQILSATPSVGILPHWMWLHIYIYMYKIHNFHRKWHLLASQLHMLRLMRIQRSRNTWMISEYDLPMEWSLKITLAYLSIWDHTNKCLSNSRYWSNIYWIPFLFKNKTTSNSWTYTIHFSN